MYRKEVYKLLNEVFELMLCNKFREDMDDTLFEKLLSVIRCKMSQDRAEDNSESNFRERLSIEDIIRNTQVIQIAEKAVLSLSFKKAELSASIQRFAIELIGILFGNESIFILQKNSVVLRELSNVLKNKAASAYCPTVQSAILRCFTDIAKHLAGIQWLIEDSLIDFVFSSFSSSSYHVRTKASSFFSEVLSMWTSEKLSSLPEREQLDNIFENIVLNLINGVQLCDSVLDDNITYCCISTLKDSFEITNVMKIINNSYLLKDQISSYFKYLNKSEVVNRTVLGLLLVVFSRDGVSENFIKGIIESLLSRQLFSPAIDLVGSILCESDKYKPISKKYIQFLIIPLQILSGSNSINNEADVFHLPLHEFHDILLKTIEVKSDCIKIVISSLLSLAKLTQFMDSETLETTLISINIVATGPACPQHHPMSYVCLENRRICFASLELFTSIITEEVYPKLKVENQCDTLNYLLCSIEKPFDFNVSMEALKLLSTLIDLNEKYSISLPVELKRKVSHLLCRKLMDKSEAVARRALLVAGEVISRDGNQFWNEAIMEQKIHLIVWEMAVHGVQESILKAASLETSVKVCMAPHFWEDIRSVKGVNEVDVMEIFFKYCRDPDFYVQRAALVCIFEWLKCKEEELPVSCRNSVLNVFSEVLRSLDMELKEIALRAWTWIVESSRSFPKATHHSDQLLKAVCDTGFASSLQQAVSDCDEAIQFQAAEILIRFRKTLLELGYNEGYVLVNDLNNTVPTSMMCVTEFCYSPVTKEERDAGIDSVMSLTTAEQIARITVSEDAPSDISSEKCHSNQLGGFPYSINSFLKMVWSKELDSLISKTDVSSDLFSESTVSLLDDIIASEEMEISHPLDDTRDCY